MNVEAKTTYTIPMQELIAKFKLQGVLREVQLRKPRDAKIDEFNLVVVMHNE